MDTQGFKVNDTVNVIVDWAREIKSKRAKIGFFQVNDNIVYANLVWSRDSDGKFTQKYGTKFSLSELKKVVTND